MTTALSNLRVLVIDDDPVYRWIVSMSLKRLGVAEVEVAGDLTAARDLLGKRPFDAAIIDFVLRGESGIDLISWIHEQHPHLLAVLLTSDSSGEAKRAIDALLRGGSSLLIKPTGQDAATRLDEALKRQLDGIAVARKVEKSVVAAPRAATQTQAQPAARDVLAIGASTGGPPALFELLSALPTDYATPIVITQHLPSFHAPMLAEQLQQRTKRKVKLFEHGERLQSSSVYLAAGKHLTVARTADGYKLLQFDGPEEHHCKPAVDPMFRSIAIACGPKAIGVVLTGMGADGAAGAATMHEAGAAILAQDRDSSVVWGMPGATVAKGVADIVGKPAELAKWIDSLDRRAQGLRRAV